jgi:hypothetical protein
MKRLRARAREAGSFTAFRCRAAMRSFVVIGCAFHV